jgi:origin recognition complex subunit 6
MSRAATEQNLFSLLPGINTLPVELVALTNSLLSQSRTKAPNLRPDEEIARGYVVANIACERFVPPLDPPRRALIKGRVPAGSRRASTSPT